MAAIEKVTAGEMFYLLGDWSRTSLLLALERRYVPEAVYDAQLNSGCMDNTRVRILSETEAWIKNPQAHQICWITGMAGSGKTSIAKTICKRANAHTKIMLGGSFFCSRSTGLAVQRDIRSVIPTLAQLLALESAEFCLALAEKNSCGLPAQRSLGAGQATSPRATTRP